MKRLVGARLPAALCVALAAAACSKPAPILPASRTDGALQILQQQVGTAMNGAGVRRAVWGLAVESLARHERLVTRNPDLLLVPASTAKLVTVAAAADTVGWDYRYDTPLIATGPISDGVLDGDLVVVGSGDPSIDARGADDIGAWVAALSARGIRRITGRIIGDDDLGEEPRPGAMWAWDDLGYPTGAIYGALNLSENVVSVRVIPGEGTGDTTTISPSADMLDRPLVNRSVTAAPGSRPLLWPEQRPGEAALTIAGSIPAGTAPLTLRVAVGNPTAWLARTLRRRLVAAGIAVDGPALDVDDLTVRPDTTGAMPILVHRSKPLSDLVQPLMKDSINLYAEATLRLITGAGGGRSNDEALAALASKLATWGAPADGIQLVDGSGLSRRDTLTATALVAVLGRMYDPSGASPWMRALPIAGRDGTLAARMRGSAAEGNVRAKTGTMSNVRSLAGYVTTADGEPLAFAILVDHFEGTGAQATAAIDAIVTTLAEFRRDRSQRNSPAEKP